MNVEAVEAEVAPRRRLRLPTLAREGGFDLRNTWQIVAGAILLPLGIGIILLAWNGAANAPVEQQQIPYMVSGGFIGLGLMIAGGLMFWAHWLYRIYDQADLHHRELLDAIRELNGGTATTEVTAAPVATGSNSFVVTGSGTTFHRPACSVVTGRRGRTRTITAAQAASMKPCRICDPLG